MKKNFFTKNIVNKFAKKMYTTFKVEEREKVVILTLNRPESLNALNTKFFEEFNNFLDSIEKSDTVRILIITGEGKAFIAGADISEMKDKTQSQGYEFGKLGQTTFERLENLPIIVIAAINGYALGGGCELAMACDIRIASKNAKLGQPEVNLGLTPGYGGTQRLPALIGKGNAMYYLLTGEQITADEAFRLGLVQKVVEPDQLIEECLNIANKILSKGPKAIRKVKFCVQQSSRLPFNEACEIELREFSSLFENEGKEGMSAFLEKRKPNW
ncbi:MAG: enoyl-CoA hydratase-related protein [Bacteroidales bacterium]|nr:enoyl-CoA hydratase-related protein [Bacteroidales bacterium]